jgi:hypothetical protein
MQPQCQSHFVFVTHFQSEVYNFRATSALPVLMVLIKQFGRNRSFENPVFLAGNVPPITRGRITPHSACKVLRRIISSRAMKDYYILQAGALGCRNVPFGITPARRKSGESFSNAAGFCFRRCIQMKRLWPLR